MEQLRTAASEARQPSRLWIIGHLPVAKQEQILGALTLIFLILAGVMLYLYIYPRRQERDRREYRDRNADALAAARPQHLARRAGQRAGIRQVSRTPATASAPTSMR